MIRRRCGSKPSFARDSRQARRSLPHIRQNRQSGVRRRVRRSGHPGGIRNVADCISSGIAAPATGQARRNANEVRKPGVGQVRHERRLDGTPCRFAATHTSERFAALVSPCRGLIGCTGGLDTVGKSMVFDPATPFRQRVREVVAMPERRRNPRWANHSGES